VIRFIAFTVNAPSMSALVLYRARLRIYQLAVFSFIAFTLS
jgi:hypothetical protein